MQKIFPTHKIKILLIVLISIYILPGFTNASDLTEYAITDLRVLYVYDDEETIDWPVIYYLNDEHNCRIDLVTIGGGSGFEKEVKENSSKEIYLHRYFPSYNDTTAIDSIISDLFLERKPDIIILNKSQNKLTSQLSDKLEKLDLTALELFGIRKVYREISQNSEQERSKRIVAVNRSELYNSYSERMTLEIPKIFPWYEFNGKRENQIAQYKLVASNIDQKDAFPDFLSGLPKIRLLHVFEELLTDGLIKESFIRQAKNFLSLFKSSVNSVGKQRVENILLGYKEIVTLERQVSSEKKLNSIAGMNDYLIRLRDKALRSVKEEIGIDWRGNIQLRDSPHGPKLKFNASLTVNGPKEVELSYVKFHPYWDTTVINLDSESKMIKPHQSFVREYLVDIERSRLEAQMPESLLFSAELVYGLFPFIVYSSVPIWESPNLEISFQPDFHFIQPFAKLNVDKVVSSMNWKAVIEKPKHYYGSVHLNLNTPRGVFAGAYRQDITMEKGRTRETIRIPFSVSNLFELGIKNQIITASVDNKIVAADTGIIRIASCSVADTIKVGFLSDSSGYLEEILRMTDATYRPLTDRTLLTGDLDAYNVILVGSGALNEYPSFKHIRGRIEEYVRNGGSLVIFGQPNHWSEGTLPVSLTPSIEYITKADILNRIEKARVLSKPHKINEEDLLSGISNLKPTAAAIVAPAERVYVTPTGATLLSVSRLGQGQIIYCGLPIVELIEELNLEAIHLFSNIMNY